MDCMRTAVKFLRFSNKAIYRLKIIYMKHGVKPTFFLNFAVTIPLNINKKTISNL